MLKFLEKFFKFKDEGSEYDNRDLEGKILDIRRRIDEQRAQLAYSEAQSFHVERHPPMDESNSSVDKARETKKADLENLKAKLLGKKL